MTYGTKGNVKQTNSQKKKKLHSDIWAQVCSQVRASEEKSLKLEDLKDDNTSAA